MAPLLQREKSGLRTFQNLGEFVSYLEEQGELIRVKEPVDPVLEVTEISDRIMKQPGGGKALIFENVKGSSIPLLINAFGSWKRMTNSLGVNKFSEITDRLEEFIKPQIPKSFLEGLAALPKLKEMASFPPKTVRSGPCQEVVIRENPSADILPMIQCWPDDAGKYITLGLTFTQDPETGDRNCGLYRIQKFDGKTFGMHWQRHKDGTSHYGKYKKLGQRMPVAIVLGGDPCAMYTGSAPLPPHIDEMLFAGFLRRKGVEMVKCVTNDLEVPAEAEIVLEGYCEPGELRTEGPFGDHTGFYSLADQYPVFHLTAVTHRKNPVYPTTIVGKPPMEDFYLGKTTERLFLPLVRMFLPEIVDMNFPAEGIFNNLCLVSIKKSYPGHARKVAHGMWGIGQLMLTKLIVVVDEDVDVQNVSETTWAVCNAIDPRRDVFFVDGPVDTLTHASVAQDFGSKMAIDGTRKWPEEGFTREWPPVIEMSEEIKKLVTEKWERYGLGR